MDMTTALKVHLIWPYKDIRGITTIILQHAFRYNQIFKAAAVRFDLSLITTLCYGNRPKKYNDNQMS